MERVMGVEPTQPAWKAGALPLSHTRKKLAGVAGLGPAECESQSLVPYHLATPQQKNGVSNGIRTHDLQGHNLAL